MLKFKSFNSADEIKEIYQDIVDNNNLIDCDISRAIFYLQDKYTKRIDSQEIYYKVIESDVSIMLAVILQLEFFSDNFREIMTNRNEELHNDIISAKERLESIGYKIEFNIDEDKVSQFEKGDRYRIYYFKTYLNI